MLVRRSKQRQIPCKWVPSDAKMRTAFAVVERIPMDHRLAALLKKWIKQHRMLSAFPELTRNPSRTNNTDRQVRSW